jgi:hypothetical protein
MSRFDLYGGSKCEKCEYYRKSTRCPTYRCDLPENTYDGRIGVVYMLNPDAKNWNHKCKNFKPLKEKGEEHESGK